MSDKPEESAHLEQGQSNDHPPRNSATYNAPVDLDKGASGNDGHVDKGSSATPSPGSKRMPSGHTSKEPFSGYYQHAEHVLPGGAPHPFDPRYPPHPGVMHPVYAYPPTGPYAAPPGMPPGWPHPQMAPGYAYTHGPPPPWAVPIEQSTTAHMSGNVGGLAMHGRKASVGSTQGSEAPESPGGRHAKKTEKACQFCRQRKLKCDGNKPICGSCSQRSFEDCYYDPAPPKRRGPGRNNKARERRESSANASEQAHARATSFAA